MNAEQTGRVAFRHVAPRMVLRIGHDRFDVDSITHASILYQEIRDASGSSRAHFPVGRLEIDEPEIRFLTIDYDGRVWCGAALEMEAA